MHVQNVLIIYFLFVCVSAKAMMEWFTNNFTDHNELWQHAHSTKSGQEPSHTHCKAEVQSGDKFLFGPLLQAQDAGWEVEEVEKARKVYIILIYSP